LIVSGKKHFDAEGLQALLANQIQVMTAYSKAVILPVLKQEKQKAPMAEQKMLKAMKPALIRADIFVDANKRSQLETFLENNGALKVVYQLREQLKAIWDRTTATQKELIDALQEWCHEAEATGIQKLQEFVPYLKGYTIEAI